MIEVQDNDFERSFSLTTNLYLKTELSTLLGSILNRLNIYNKALKSLLNARSILEEFEGYKGYSHPILIQVKERISYLENL
jgi:hypothetical protein